MKKLILIATFLISLQGIAFAQDKSESRGHGYLFAATGFVGPNGPAILHFGGGGEALVYKGVGVGAELGYIASPQNFGEFGLGALSVNGSYHFQPKQKLDPFVTGGYTLFIREGAANLFNVGGGVNYWIKDGMALRLEFRDHVSPGYGTAAHFLNFRIGLTFR
jgi:opacity protein-like surface antigen